MVAYELMLSMQNRRRNHKEGFMALKLDMSKAYDRLEWSFVQLVLQRMGFVTEWIELIMECIGTVSYSILLNGSPQSPFKPSRDDSLVFCKAKLQEWGRLHNILSSYELASGQRLNLEKSSIYFSKNTRQEIQNSILATTGIKASRPFEKYLGLPSYIGKSKSRAFLPIIDRIKAQMTNWKTNLLSPAGKEVLLKSVIQSIPTYCMGIFLIPKGILRNINKLMQSFWWGIRNQNPKMHWLSWKGLGKLKQVGGLGFRDFEDFNRALLAKQGWRIITNPQSLASRVLKAKYFPLSDFSSARVKRSDSYVWKSITAARPLLYEGLLWKIGNGNTVKIWSDRWLPIPTTYKSQSPPKVLNSEATVSSLIDQDTHS
ncbi:hypothetical protein F2P56_037156 [Juglans regia]|uniref:Uncharacterized protein LOC108999113 n=2 Tax=Juglans regia TaxID=51240 RepID=A0A2I4FII3_JUGRE|nr:uncharacterized protein LOC108999113 [Juglans regia]KAF5441892.1 hypothetical protein F2P56_037156 [Juglans regia]